MKKLFRRLMIILGIPKSFYLCIRTMPFKNAIKLPIIVSPLTRLISLNGSINLTNEVRFGTIKIGFDGLALANGKHGVIENDGMIVLGEKINLGGGIEISCRQGAKLSIGAGTKMMGETKIFCSKEISIGKDCRISWNTQIMDTDFHSIYEFDNLINESAPVFIDDKVWICSGTKIYKGVSISSGCIVAADSSIHKSITEENSIVTGMPIKFIKRNIKWIP